MKSYIMIALVVASLLGMIWSVCKRIRQNEQLIEQIEQRDKLIEDMLTLNNGRLNHYIAELAKSNDVIDKANFALVQAREALRFASSAMRQMRYENKLLTDLLFDHGTQQPDFSKFLTNSFPSDVKDIQID